MYFQFGTDGILWSSKPLLSASESGTLSEYRTMRRGLQATPGFSRLSLSPTRYTCSIFLTRNRLVPIYSSITACVFAASPGIYSQHVINHLQLRKSNDIWKLLYLGSEFSPPPAPPSKVWSHVRYKIIEHFFKDASILV